MLTSLDKAIVALVVAAASIWNIVTGSSFQVDQQALLILLNLASPILVWLIPNKPPRK